MTSTVDNRRFEMLSEAYSAANRRTLALLKRMAQMTNEISLLAELVHEAHHGATRDWRQCNRHTCKTSQELVLAGERTVNDTTVGGSP